MRKVVVLCLYSLWVSFALAQSAAPYPATDDEFVGPFSSWLNVKNYGAKGDGVTDETAAIQAALNAIGNENSRASVVFIPAGTYLIKGTLRMNYKINVSIIGANPSTTIIKWGGAKNGTMLQVNGTAYSRFERITWNGNKNAAIAVDQSWDGSNGYFDTGNEYAENIFTDVGMGIRGGFLNNGFAETTIIRCKFIRNTNAGVSLGNFNALDIWVWYSVFQDCNVGVTNSAGAGNFKVYGCIFRNSKLSDITIGNTGEFSFRDNTSTNSNAFLLTQFTGNPATISIQGNVIIDPAGEGSPIEIRNQGPVTFMDNIIRSRTGFTNPVVWFNTFPDGDLVAIGNTYTVNNPIDAAGIRTVIYDNPTVSRSSLNNLKEPSIPKTRVNYHRQVFEVPANANAATIQSIIKKADAKRGNRPVVHFPYGAYFINSTITLPSGTDIQLIGDGNGDLRPTWLKWSGTAAGGPVLRIAGPTKATIRDLTVDGGETAVGIQIQNVDQKGARVFLQQSEVHNNQTNFSVNGLDHTLVMAHNSGFSNGSVNSIEVIGGSLAQAGTPQEGRTIIYAGAESDNTISHQVTKGGNLLIRDVWYESGSSGQYLVLPGSGIFTAEGCHATAPQNMSVPQLSLNNFNGRAVISTTNFSNDVVVKGNGSKTSFLSIANLSDRSSYLTNTTSPSGDIRSLNVRARSGSGSSPLNNVGNASKIYITTMFDPIRTVHADVLTSLPGNVTDLRLFKVWVLHGTKGIELKNASAASSSSAENKTKSSIVNTPDSITTTMNVFPNPVVDEATVSIQATESTIIHFRLFDSRGALVKTFETNIHTGSNVVKLNTKGLTRGSYILQAAWSGKITSNKLIKE